MKILALDIGRRHTGVAYADSDIGIALPLGTVDHENERQLVEHVKLLVEKRSINTIVIGRPLFMSGSESDQTRFTEHISSLLEESCQGCKMQYIDERWTSNTAGKDKRSDPHAQAAVSILRIFLERKRF